LDSKIDSWERSIASSKEALNGILKIIEEKGTEVNIVRFSVKSKLMTLTSALE